MDASSIITQVSREDELGQFNSEKGTSRPCPAARVPADVCTAELSLSLARARALPPPTAAASLGVRASSERLSPLRAAAPEMALLRLLRSRFAALGPWIKSACWRGG